MAHLIFNKSTLHTLRYLRRGHERAADQFWLLDQSERIPPGRLARLLKDGLIERAAAPNGDLFRITADGLAVLEAA